MEMNLLYEVQQLAEARAATKPPAARPPRVSLRERLTKASAAEEARLYEEKLLRARYADPTTDAGLRALRRREREGHRQYTREQALEACQALFEAGGWGDPAAAETTDESDSEEEGDDPAVEARATRLNARAAQLWRQHEQGIAATTPRYVEGVPVRHAEGPPRVRRRVGMVREAARCAGCSAEGLRCSRATYRRRDGPEGEEVCERCRRRGEVCEDGKEEEDGGTGVMEVVGSGVVEVQRGRFAPRMARVEEE